MIDTCNVPIDHEKELSNSKRPPDIDQQCDADNLKNISEDHEKKVIQENDMEDIETIPQAQGKQCKVCGKKFKKSFNRKVHERIHTKEKPFQCKTCNFKSFRQLAHLNRHEGSHKKKNEVKISSCETCDLIFFNFATQEFHAKNYPDHIMKQNQEIQTFKPDEISCKICNRKFKKESSKYKHERIVHKNTQTS